MTAFLLDPHEGREEWVGEDRPVRKTIAKYIHENPCHLNERSHWEIRAEANGIKAGNDERNWVKSQNAERGEHNVTAINSGPGSNPLPDEFWVEKR